MTQFKVFPYRLHTSGGHVVQVYAEYSNMQDLMDYLIDKQLVNIFWTQSSTGSIFVPCLVRGDNIEIVAPVFGRSGVLVEKDHLGNLTTDFTINEKATTQVNPGKSVKKRK